MTAYTPAFEWSNVLLHQLEKAVDVLFAVKFVSLLHDPVLCIRQSKQIRTRK